MPWLASSLRGLVVRPSLISSSTAVCTRCSFCKPCMTPSCICALRAASNLPAMIPPAADDAFDQAAPLTNNAASVLAEINSGDLCRLTFGANARCKALPDGKLGATNLRNNSAVINPATASVAATGSKATRGERKSNIPASVIPKIKVALNGMTQLLRTKRAFSSGSSNFLISADLVDDNGSVLALRSAPQCSQKTAFASIPWPQVVQNRQLIV